MHRATEWRCAGRFGESLSSNVEIPRELSFTVSGEESHIFHFEQINWRDRLLHSTHKRVTIMPEISPYRPRTRKRSDVTVTAEMDGHLERDGVDGSYGEESLD